MQIRLKSQSTLHQTPPLTPLRSLPHFPLSLVLLSSSLQQQQLRLLTASWVSLVGRIRVLGHREDQDVACELENSVVKSKHKTVREYVHMEFWRALDCITQLYLER